MSTVELPTYVQMEPVGQCNLRCQMCSIQFRQDGPPFGPLAFMRLEDFTSMLGQFPALAHLHLQGLGEPIMHPRFFDMVRYATDRGVRVSTNTNGTLINARRAEACVTSGLDCVHLSIDGATAETYERIRVRAHFDRVTANLERLLETRDRLGSETPRIRLVTVIMRQNLHELPDLVTLAHRWAAEGLFVQHLCHDFGESTLPEHYRPMRDFVSEQTLLEENPERVEKYFSAARALADALGVDLRLPRTRPRAHPPGTPGRKRCSWPWTGAYISYEGKAMPCCMVSTPDRINFGSMGEHRVEAVWNSEEFRDFRARLDSDTPPDLCTSCSVYKGTF